MGFFPPLYRLVRRYAGLFYGNTDRKTQTLLQDKPEEDLRRPAGWTRRIDRCSFAPPEIYAPRTLMEPRGPIGFFHHDSRTTRRLRRVIDQKVGACQRLKPVDSGTWGRPRQIRQLSLFGPLSLLLLTMVQRIDRGLAPQLL